MRKVSITAQGPLGWKDTTDVFMEDDLLLTAGGVVKPARKLKEGDVLIRFSSALCHWEITKMEWARKTHTSHDAGH